MNIVVLGAAGATGRLLVEQALAQRHRVTAFVRTPANLAIAAANLRIVQGDVTDTAAIQAVLPGHHAVLCTLGNASPLRRDPALVAAVGRLVAMMERNGPRRLVYLSFLGVAEGRHQLGPLLRVLALLLLRNEVADHAAKERVVRNSRLDWTIVRAPKLTNGPATASYRHGCAIQARSLLPAVTRADVAGFMLGQLGDLGYLRRAPAILP